MTELTRPVTREALAAKLEASFARIRAREAEICAWSSLHEAGAYRQAAEVSLSGPLAGMTLGVKDTIDVRGLPCEAGCLALKGCRASLDAAIVAELKAMGAIVLGKTRTAELAFLSPPETRNPLDLKRSPGGSSSGSAAAVADGHVDVALGTQTAGSILRPASFCGVVGFKPSHGRFSLAGALPTAPSLDTMGWLTRNLAMTVRAFEALSDEMVVAAPFAARLLHMPHWERADPGMIAQITQLAERIGAGHGADVLARIGTDVDDIHARVMGYELKIELATLRLQRFDRLTVKLQHYMQEVSVSYPAYLSACQARDRFDFETVFGGANILIAPATLGEAVPFGETGDPAFNRFATLFGLPAITLPIGVGDTGLPLGLQLMARKGEDARLLGAALWLENLLSSEDERS
ncbi:amidase [Celeribacter sp.]|uniref:amidase n=1 Tax=Celeribacter sp. TaxID=1890673 RepID=UPI003A8FE1F5